MSGITGGPKVVTDGLVLWLDTADNQSFRGEPTVNLVNNPIFDGSIGASPTGWGSAGTSSIRRLTQSTLFPNFNAWECEVTLNNTTASITRSLPTLTAGQTYTFSIWVEEFNYLGGNFPIISLFNTTISSGFRSIGRTGISNEQPTITTSTIIKNQRIDFTFTVSTTTTSAFVRIGPPHTSSGGYLRVSKIQLEQKPYATPFVNGTRGTTVATGGGWADMSGNSIHGELVNNPTFDSDNLGSLAFDGVDDYIHITNNATNFIINNNIQSTSFWIKTTVSIEQTILGGVINIPTNSYNGNIMMAPNGRIGVVYGQSSNTNQKTSTSTINDGTWKFITIVDTDFSGTSNSRLSIYINGTPESLVINGLTSARISNEVAIGRRVYQDLGLFFNGNISGVQFYNRALASDEILQNYNATKSRYGL